MKRAMLLAAPAAIVLAAGVATPASAQDPAAVNAEFIRVQVDNDRVRVFETTLAPGDKERLHSHPSSVIHVISGGRVRNHDGAGKVTEAEFSAGATLYRDPLAHWTENIGATTIRVLVIELKDPK